MRRILLIGRNGQVGWELERSLAPLGDVSALDRGAMDLADPDSIRMGIRASRPAVVVNAAAYTAVDRAETEPELAMVVNGTAPGIIAEEAGRIGAMLVHYSTDYVFDGAKEGPYVEDDMPGALNVYGKTKLAGEEAIRSAGSRYIIFRTSWVYGTRGRNFLLTILRLLKERDVLEIVDDQFGAPTWSRMIAEATAQILARFMRKGGGIAFSRKDSRIYHLSAGGFTSWHGFALAIAGHARPEGHCRIVPVPSESYRSAARRPRNSVMSSNRVFEDFGVRMPDWGVQLKLCLGDKPDV